MRAGAGKLIVLATDRAKERVSLQVRDVVLADIQPRPQGRGCFSHSSGVTKEDPSLKGCSRSGVYFGGNFPVRGHPVKTDAAGQRRLARTLPHLDVGGSKTAGTVGLLPAEDASDDELLKWLKVERLTVKLSVCWESKVGEELEYTSCRVMVKVQSAFVTTFEIVKMSLACQPNESTSDDIARKDSSGITFNRAFNRHT
jgi:hypothetical protein